MTGPEPGPGLTGTAAAAASTAVLVRPVPAVGAAVGLPASRSAGDPVTLPGRRRAAARAQAGRPVAVLAERGDIGAAGVAREVAARLGGERVLLLTPGMLARSRWSHRVGPDGRASTRIVLPDGRLLDSARTGAVLHRLDRLPAVGLRRADAKDLAYARTELLALLASWLLGLGPRVLGPVSASGAARGSLSPTAALAHAARCGLPVARRGGATRVGLLDRPAPGERLVPHLDWPGGRGAPVPADLLPDPGAGPSERLLLCGERLVGALAGRYAEPSRRLGALLGSDLLELRFTRGVLAEVDVCPPLAAAEQRSAVAEHLVALAEAA
ncbi:hypothetical protein [Kitasatospora cinereorecta]|uniref:hypothetical protein n=1 Tax=Kitasatospora cinereorecta TaxID=285560 RepID=UPI0031F7341C